MLLVAVLAAAGCYKGPPSGESAGGGDSDTEGGASGATDGGDTSDVDPAPEAGGVGISGLRRLSRSEFDNTLRDLVGDETRPAQTRLPEDVIDPFDNQFANQLVSTVLIEGLEQLAIDVSRRLVESPSRRDMVVGCTPTGNDDADCMDEFIARFGRRALRRPLSTDEHTNLSELAMAYAAVSGDFYEGVDVVVRTLLQHPAFVYRVEVGSPTDEAGVFKLDDFEVASRLSYFIWGSMPDDELLDLAEAGGLETPEDIRAEAERLLTDDRARDRIDRFHSMWLGYYTLPHAAEVTTAMRGETRKLLEDVVFDNPRSYTDVFTAGGTWINDTLAELYGLPAPGTDELVWTEYDGERQGLLSHGSFLSVAARFGDTSPTQRGILIRTRLLCQEIPPPPPDVDVDNPPESTTEGACKVDRYAEHRENGACRSCHELVDPVGFGLEQYDQMGRFRTVEADNPECSIDGQGEIDGTPFSGPAGLANYIIDNQLLDACVVGQVYAFAMGHPEGEDDQRFVDDLMTSFSADGHRFDQLMLSLVSDEAFMFRREEQ
jgi:hypothetical protein